MNARPVGSGVCSSTGEMVSSSTCAGESYPHFSSLSGSAGEIGNGVDDEDGEEEKERTGAQTAAEE